MDHKLMLKEKFNELHEIINRGWTKGNYAVDGKDKRCGVTDDKACKFCLLGAVEKIQYDSNVSDETAAMMVRMLSYEIGKFYECENLVNYHTMVWNYNDAWGTTKNDVLTVIKNVIESI